MKRYLLLGITFIFFIGTFSSYAHDLIILKDGNTIEVKVVEMYTTP